MLILLTGGAGYIGSHTCLELIRRGHEIVVLDNLSNSSRESLRRVQEITGHTIALHVGDLADPEVVREIFSTRRIDAVIHFAGLKSVSESLRNPLKYYQTNLGSTLALLQQMESYGIKKLVFSSSATVYGDPCGLPSKEDSPIGIALSNPYGRTKSMIEQILQDAAFADPLLSIAALRYFNPIGAHESGRIGEDPKQEPNNLFPYISQVAIGLRPKVSVFGGNYPTIDGTGVRDYIHVMDLAEGHAAALEYLKPGFDAYNLGSGCGASVLEVIAAFSRVSKSAIPYDIVAERPGDVAASYADVSKASRDLKWTTSRSLEVACRDAWAWQSANPTGYVDNG
ncbi:UDP-glucose 4-epimerase GalE [Cryobacterium sp. TMT1-3]|uniref:UDP-glucose 4-epimerase GalE n=1 Tax=Cryobacterium sp. TMT1-3 TaxID=1259237 RepID=UPI00106B4657|nr:UDP-glucose 4-epimerase GalE [Cryobacterium sp. TMT1-3]TFC29353.1 UDP-glucose 4-epimerase GalE [Cryobacterium sp. TMT1-3]